MDDGQHALALTDSGNLFGAIEFYKACKQAKIKPILGMTAYCAEHGRDKPSGANNRTYQLTLLAANQEGWSNLRLLSSQSYLTGFHYRPRIDLDLCKEHHQGLIALSGGLSGELDQRILANDMQGAMQHALELQEIFGKGNFFLEILATGYEPQTKASAGLIQIHEETGIPLVATNDVHYQKPEDWVAQDILLCIREGRVLNDDNRFKMGSRELFFKSHAQMAESFAAQPEALSNTLAIAERCNVELDFKTYHLPVFHSENEEDPEKLFMRVCHEGAKDRYGKITTTIEKRLEYEIGIILKLGFASYFLITADFIQHARNKNIAVGPGRGSAAGSIVAYCMGITDLDPLRYNLIFERFLNADRISMPDIDVDFCGKRRDEVIDYVRQKYGHENVSQIITFGTMASRGVLRDVGRVLEVPLPDVDKIAKKVPQGPGASLRKALEEDKELKEIRDASITNKKLFDLGLKLEGLARHSSIHAAGVVISDKPLREYVPLAKNGDDIMTQWQMTELEEVGLLKVDFLGLKTLTILQEAVRLIEEVHSVEVDLDHLPLDDKITYELMTRGDTLGVFQLESSGMRELLSKLKPDSFEDVIAVLALYRPGPLGSGMVDMFVDRKHGREKTEYPHESIKSILEETYGVIVYQEQVMRIANVLAGFSMNEADALRKAMGKKQPEVMAKYKDLFVQGAESNGHKEKFATNLFETIEYFAGYGFNKSHSAAYALLTYQTAYLKAHYPLEFVAANLTVESGNTDKVKEFVDELKATDIQVQSPNLNEGFGFFGVVDGAITFGLRAIKGVGQKIADAVSEERTKNGPYTSMDDFCVRHDPSQLNKTALDALCKAGAMDVLGITRKSAAACVEQVLKSAAQTRDDRRKGQGSLFDIPDERQQPQPSKATGEWSETERLAMEKEAIGFYLSGHPFEKQGRFLARIAGHDSNSLHKVKPGDSVRVAGMISGMRILQIKSGRNAGKKMARFNLEDLHGVIPVTCFARAYESCSSVLNDDAIVLVTGRLDSKSEEIALLLEEIAPAQQVIKAEVGAMVIRLQENQVTDRTLEQIAKAVHSHGGDLRLHIEVQQQDAVFRISTDSRFTVNIEPELLDDLAQATSPDSLMFARK